MRSVGIVLFDGFELLDVFGPAQLLSIVPKLFEVELIGPRSGPVRSSQGSEVLAQLTYSGASAPDIVLVPGGEGTRSLVRDQGFLPWLREFSTGADIVASVCTGSAVLAAAGLLEGYRATSNKQAFSWAIAHGNDVRWVPEARWVEDRDRWTSSGVAAGMDMTVALAASLCGDDVGELIATTTELDVHSDSRWDPFARRHGLV